MRVVVLAGELPRFVVAGAFADPANARRIYLAALGMLTCAVVLLIATLWWWRTSRVEHPSLAPLEVMSGRRWGRATYSERKRQLDGVRPDGASSPDEGVRVLEPVDLRGLVRATPPSFDDLKDAAAEQSIDEFLASLPGPSAAELYELPEPPSAPVADDVMAAPPSADMEAMTAQAANELNEMLALRRDGVRGAPHAQDFVWDPLLRKPAE